MNVEKVMIGAQEYLPNIYGKILKPVSNPIKSIHVIGWKSDAGITSFVKEDNFPGGSVQSVYIGKYMASRTMMFSVDSTIYYSWDDYIQNGGGIFGS